MITVQIEHLNPKKAQELYTLLVNSEYISNMSYDINYKTFSSIEVTGAPQILKILSEYFND